MFEQGTESECRVNIVWAHCQQLRYPVAYTIAAERLGRVGLFAQLQREYNTQVDRHVHVFKG